MMKAWRGWEKFWFEAKGDSQLRLFGRLSGAVLFVFYLVGIGDVNWIFSDRGLFPAELLREVWPGAGQFSVLSYITGDPFLWMLYGVRLASLLAIAMGWKTRVAAPLAFFTQLAFLHRNSLTAYGVDFIGTSVLFYLSIAGFGKVSRSLAFRLCQVQVCLIYAYSGMGKLRGAQWWNGEAIWDVLGNPQLVSWDFSWISHFPAAIAAATYLTLLWEVYFAVLVWSGARKWVLILGVFFHLGIGLTLNLPFFGLLMISTYVLFMKQVEIDALCDFIHTKSIKFAKAASE